MNLIQIETVRSRFFGSLRGDSVIRYAWLVLYNHVRWLCGSGNLKIESRANCTEENADPLKKYTKFAELEMSANMYSQLIEPCVVLW